MSVSDSEKTKKKKKKKKKEEEEEEEEIKKEEKTRKERTLNFLKFTGPSRQTDRWTHCVNCSSSKCLSLILRRQTKKKKKKKKKKEEEEEEEEEIKKEPPPPPPPPPKEREDFKFPKFTGPSRQTDRWTHCVNCSSSTASTKRCQTQPRD